MLTFSLNHHEFVLRYLTEEDVEQYLTFFNELSEESIRCRFGHLIANLTKSAAKERTHGNTASEKALAVFSCPQARIVAIGRCYPDDKTADSEIALVVSDSMRRSGMGRFLLKRLIRIARDEKSRTVSAFIATKNAPIMHLLQSTGFVVQSVNAGDDLKLILKLSPENPNEPNDPFAP